MLVFSFNAALEMIMSNKQDGGPSRVEEMRFSLGHSANLKKDVYLREDGLPTPEGVKILSALLANAINSLMNFAKKNEYPNASSVLPFIEETIKRGQAIEAEGGIGTMEEPTGKKAVDIPTRKSTDKELVDELRARNNVYQYDELIRNAVAKMYHDFKAPEDVICGKALLVDDLSAFPELSDIREKVIAGEYDEAPDEDDRKEMSEWLMGQRSSHTDKMDADDKLAYSPKLMAVMQKIKETIVENDVGALVVLHTPGYAQDYMRLDPSYSAVRVDGNRIHLRAKLEEDFAGDVEAQHKKIADTMNMFKLLSEVGIKDALHMQDVYNQADVHLNAEHTPAKYTPNSDN